ncbi:hypothetical protein QBC42DRAFT_264743 [Cladorrhinum samala]|uniref:Uncharacterized protein n=1 Tax=Cladorrhinum samala TaxID=585594 RepID=A0AAV9HWC1_9PEZI|nr:hypothetical protein QBC42DRAFT_264743 [Cladorrhinum samala]
MYGPCLSLATNGMLRVIIFFPFAITNRTRRMSLVSLLCMLSCTGAWCIIAGFSCSTRSSNV